MKVNASCLDCEDRYLGCHDKCEKYKRFKELNEQQKTMEAEYYKKHGVKDFRYYRNRWHSS